MPVRGGATHAAAWRDFALSPIIAHRVRIHGPPKSFSTLYAIFTRGFTRILGTERVLSPYCVTRLISPCPEDVEAKSVHTTPLPGRALRPKLRYTSASAARYIIPPMSMVSRSPRYIARKMALTDPSTLAAAFSDQAQRNEGL